MKSFFDHNTGHLTITHMLHVAGIFTNICPKNHPNVVKYTIHGAFGLLVIYIVYILYIYTSRFSHTSSVESQILESEFCSSELNPPVFRPT